MAQADMVFDITGSVTDAAHHPMANHNMKAVIDYHQYRDGVSQPGEETVHFSTTGNGSYFFAFPGPNSPLLGYDLDWGLVVSVANDQTGYKTVKAGQYSAKPQPPSPVNIHPLDTILDVS